MLTNRGRWSDVFGRARKGVEKVGVYGGDMGAQKEGEKGADAVMSM